MGQVKAHTRVPKPKQGLSIKGFGMIPEARWPTTCNMVEHEQTAGTVARIRPKLSALASSFLAEKSPML